MTLEEKLQDQTELTSFWARGGSVSWLDTEYEEKSERQLKFVIYKGKKYGIWGRIKKKLGFVDKSV